MKKILLSIYLCLSVVFSKSQSITPDDFRLCLDNYPCPDSTLKLTRKQLYEAKKFVANFSWFTITNLTFYFSPEFGNDVTVQNCQSDNFCSKLKPLLDRCRPGGIIHVVAQGHNKAGKIINWAGMTIKIIE
ncbi:MAG: hypothetical protein QM687_00135 [Ferruginibacter sp.]